MLHKVSKNTKHILLWCSPGFGLIDIWLPVVRELKKKHYIKVDFVFPEPSSLRLEDKDSDLFSLAGQYADDVIYRGHSGAWFISPTLIEAQSGIRSSFNNFDEKIIAFSGLLVKGRMSKFSFLKGIGKYILMASKRFIRMKEIFGSQSPYDFDLLDSVSGILCDITKEGKTVNKELRNKLRNVHRFSMFHGIAAIWVDSCFICKRSVVKRPDTTVYNTSSLEVDGYKKCFGILEKNIVHAGIPKHDRDWIEFICSRSNIAREEELEPFVFFIGRPASPYNTVERKRKALKDIYDIVCIKHKLKLVIKTHPKETLDGIDGDIYRDALGLKNYGKNWIYSNNHPFILGKKATFSISLFSSVAVDMLAINKPTIEYLDLSGLTSYDNSESLRNKYGKPVLQFSYTNLVLSASSKAELEQHVESILDQYELTFSKLYSKYKEYYNPYDGASKMVADDICEKLI